MNQRERTLSILVGGLLIGLGLWWMLGTYQAAVKKRSNLIANKTNSLEAADDLQFQGLLAERQMGHYLERSLPSSDNLASRQYSQWLLDTVERHFKDGSVDPQQIQPAGDLYKQYSFLVKGKTDIPAWINWMHEFYAKDYLHRIRSWSLRPERGGKGFLLEFTVDALSINGRADDLPIPTQPSYRVSGDVAQYRDAILNRNLFEPPNGEPRFTGSDTVTAFVGKQNTIPLTFEDPEKQPLEFELIQSPEGSKVTLDPRSGNLRIEEAVEGEFELSVRATDNGYPRRSVEQKLAVQVRPPEAAPEPEVKLKFDDAKQTFLTGLVQDSEREAWMNVRTRGETLRLRVGDSFEIGSVKGKVLELNSRAAVLEVAGKTYELKLNGQLKEAVGGAEEAKEEEPKSSDSGDKSETPQTGEEPGKPSEPQTSEPAATPEPASPTEPAATTNPAAPSEPAPTKETAEPTTSEPTAKPSE
jgi:hypothetical protein